MGELFDVVEVDMETFKVGIMAEGKSARNADAIEFMAIMRRGVDTHFFAAVAAGKYREGDEWEGL